MKILMNYHHFVYVNTLGWFAQRHRCIFWCAPSLFIYTQLSIIFIWAWSFVTAAVWHSKNCGKGCHLCLRFIILVTNHVKSFNNRHKNMLNNVLVLARIFNIIWSLFNLKCSFKQTLQVYSKIHFLLVWHTYWEVFKKH